MSPVIPIAIHNQAGQSNAGQSSGAKCSLCSFSKFCLPQGLNADDVARLDQIIARRRRVQRDEALFSMGQPFQSLYAVRFGHFKTAQVNQRGEQQIGGFHMAGDLLGMEAIGAGQHGCSAVALEDSEVCEIPFARLQELVMQVPGLLQQFHRTMSREIQREQSVMLFLSHMRAEQRLALFLLNLANRYADRGYSATSFQLRMSREDMGGYLGLTVESVSRQLAKLKSDKLIALSNRDLRILDRERLEAMSSGVLADCAKAA